MTGRTSNAWCPRCMVELPDGRCRRCGWDFNVSKVTAADRAVMATLLGRRGGKSR